MDTIVTTGNAYTKAVKDSCGLVVELNLEIFKTLSEYKQCSFSKESDIIKILKEWDAMLEILKLTKKDFLNKNKEFI